MGICGKELLYAFVVMIGSMQLGTIVIYSSPAGRWIREAHHLKATSFEWSFYNAVVCLFAVVGPFFTRFLLNIFKGSRKKSLFVITVIATVFWLIHATIKFSIWAGIVMRALLGITVGAYSAVCPMYLVELSPEGVTGFFGSLHQIGIVIGQVFINFVGANINYVDLNYIGAALPALQAILLWFIIESPAVKKIEEESSSFHKEEKEKKNDVRKPIETESVFQKKYVKGLVIGVTMMFMQQFSGINGILTNLGDIMTNAGLNLDGNYQAGISTISQLIAVFVGSLLMDRLGRKMVWLLSSAIDAVALLIFALNEKYGWSNVLPLIMIFLYQLGFGLGLAPIPWFLIPEYFNDAVRPAATMVCTISNWLFAFIIVYSWPEMVKGMGMFGAMILFFAVCVLAFIFGFFYITEPEAFENEVNANDEEALSTSSSSDRPEML